MLFVLVAALMCTVFDATVRRILQPLLGELRLTREELETYRFLDYNGLSKTMGNMHKL